MQSASSSSSPPVLSSTPPGRHSSASVEFPPLVNFRHEDASKTASYCGRRRTNSGSGDSLNRLTSQLDHSGYGGTGSRQRGPSTTVFTTASRLRVSRDPTQPSSGSLRSLHSISNEGSADDEEFDEFPVIGGVRTAALGGEYWSTSLISTSSPNHSGSGQRPRASTCPETKAFRRRALARAMNRPPTPTPTALDDVRENVRSGDCCAVYESSDDGEIREHSEDSTTVAVRAVSADKVDVGGNFERCLHITDHSVDGLTRRVRPCSELPLQGQVKLPSLHPEVDRRFVTLSDGKSADRYCGVFGMTFAGGSCSGSSELLPVITETM